MSLSFSVYIGIPGSLTIEIQPSRAIAQNKPSVIYPPLREPLTTGGQPIGNQWGRFWATPMTNRLNALGGSSNLQLLSFEAPSIDTTDNLWYATGTVDATTDPVTITAPLTGTSIYGRTFAAGDYIIWDDPTSANGLYQYEIDRITVVNGQVFTLSRSQQNAPPGQSYFGAVRAAHSGVKFYRLLDPSFRVLWDGSSQVFKFLWDQMIVSAVSAVTTGDSGLVNLFPIPPTAAATGLAT